ncbi:MAG: glycoside hydrolase family 3 protein [Candidatus Rhabdochlamydia sp.]
MRLWITLFFLQLGSSLFSFEPSILEEMTLEEKVGQILMVHFQGSCVNEEAKLLIQKTHIGSIIYYNWSNALSSPFLVKRLSEDLQQIAHTTRLSIPLLIAIDQEGGLVTRLSEGFTLFPGNKALGMTGNPSLAWESAYCMGREMQEVGINLVLGPVVDINTHPTNPVIGLRSFGSTPLEVISYGKKAIKGFHQAGIATCLKHYPGHGSVTVDSHYDLPFTDKSLKELQEEELSPFTHLAHKTDAIMTAHILHLALDEARCATLSPKALRYLRDELHFKGAIITDSLAMQGVLKQCEGNIIKASIQAINAGCDLLCLGGRHLAQGTIQGSTHFETLKIIHEELVQAVKQGEISEDRLNEAVANVLALKKSCLFLKEAAREKPPLDFNNLQKHQKVARKISAKALKIVKDNPTLLKDLSQKNIAFIAPLSLEKSLLKEPFSQIGKSAKFLFFSQDSLDSNIEILINEIEASDTLVIFSVGAWKNLEQKRVIDQIIDLHKHTILVVTKEPLDVELFPKADITLCTFSPSSPSLHAVYSYLKNNSGETAP